MITRGLYTSVLIDPRRRANRLFIVSGYASATFARRHLLELLEINENVEINLIIGMPGKKSDHIAFIQLHEEFPDNFKGYYLNTTPPVHSKVYSWYNNRTPVFGFAGSANYSQYGFFETQQVNQISEENPTRIKNLFDTLLRRSIYMPEMEVEIPEGHREAHIPGSIPAGTVNWEIPDKRVTISFLQTNGTLPAGGSGLNWGQRLEKRVNRKTGKVSYVQRESNQAYLGLRLSSRNEGFLPPRAITFTLVTDDGHSFDCVVAQDNRKAIETNKNNSLLGVYMRNRLGVALGQPVRIEDLERYGRTDFTIEKIDDETFLLDFSVD